NYWYICPSGTCTGNPPDGDNGWKDTGVQATGNTGDPGVTPKLRIGAAPDYYWQVCTSGTCSVDSETGWENVLDSDEKPVKATGDKGEQGDAIFAKDGIDYSNPDYVVFTLANKTEITVPKYRPLNISFQQPAAFDLGQPRDIDFTFTGNVKTITAVDVPRGWTVAPDLAGTITVTAPAADGKYYTASGTATLLVSDGAERTITAPLALECPAYTPPATPDIAFTPPGVFNNSEEKSFNFTDIGNVQFVGVAAVTDGWTVKVTRNGTAGTFTVTAPNSITAENASGEAVVLVSGSDGRTVTRILQLLMMTPPYAASSQIWSFGDSQFIWSDAIQMPDCDKVDFKNSTTEPQCRSYTDEEAADKSYYNRVYVNENNASMCPSPWRTPTTSDFDELVKSVGANTVFDNWRVRGSAAEGAMHWGELVLRVSDPVTSDQGDTYYRSNSVTHGVVCCMVVTRGLMVNCVR
ncbi:MAG: DUF4988 domain-containing protein, partial [Prevotellaceae bacterium]|nr:DUF4988 domain-containing protein [Prevotellaceae bacterium]